MRLTFILSYAAVIFILGTTTVLALLDGGFHIAGGAIAGVAAVSAITSLLPFFLSIYLLKKYEQSERTKTYLKIIAILLYLTCFPVKLYIIYLNTDMLINGGPGWSFG
ncbi:MAG: hypothetical protein EP305_05925 [Bacteroidetes bacterium]|nr:MAG: hypothetical protein EP305_05925 [Bacteroidota bacterium]